MECTREGLECTGEGLECTGEGLESSDAEPDVSDKEVNFLECSLLEESLREEMELDLVLNEVSTEDIELEPFFSSSGSLAKDFNFI